MEQTRGSLGKIWVRYRKKSAVSWPNSILCYKLLWFEDQPPNEFPELWIASVSTHDLPTIARLWTGVDFAAAQRIGMRPDETNMPGTIHQWPNWSLALPLPLEQIESLPFAQTLASSLRRPEREQPESEGEPAGGPPADPADPGVIPTS